MIIDAVLQELGDLERSLADLYGWYSDLFATDPEVAFVFRKLQGEETSHASLVEYQRRVVEKTPGLPGRVDVDLTEIESALKEARALRSVPEAPSVVDAIREALRLETSAAENHHRNALKHANRELGRLLDALGGEDRLHVARLLELARARGVPIPAPGVA